MKTTKQTKSQKLSFGALLLRTWKPCLTVGLAYLFSKVMVLRSFELFAAPRTVAHQAPLSMGFSRQEHWSGLSCPPPGDLPDLGIETTA